MKTKQSKLFTTEASLLFGILCIASLYSYADDTEIYVGGNAGASLVRPNVLFIVDTSGSMNDDVTYTVPYDPAQTYSGSCDVNQIYWSSNGRAPNCNANKYFASISNTCKDSFTALNTYGLYTGILARYKVSTSPQGVNTSTWTSFSSNDHASNVECAADNGKHGNGTDTTKLYAADAVNGGPWTATAANAINWSNSGTSYTLYTGNYLNYVNSGSSTVTQTKMQIVKNTFESVMNSTSGINVGLMRFSSNGQGGYFMAPMQELNDTNRPNFISSVNALSANGNTPLAETMYEASLYFQGKSVKYGSASTPGTNVTSVLDTSDTSKYKSPIEYQCQKNFVVYMTDGDPTSDTDADSLIAGLPGFQSITGKATCTGDCLDELAQWMHKSDMRSDLNDTQNVSTYTIGVNIDTNLLLDTANKGGGKYFATYGSVDMTNAFTSILTDILAVNTTFIAPAVTVNAFNRLNNRDDLFYAVFKPAGAPNWPGNVKHYKLAGNPAIIVDANNAAAIDANTGFFSGSSTSIWTLSADAPDGDDVTKGGAAGLLTTSRHIYTYLGSTAPNNVDLTATTNKFDETNTDLTYGLLNISANDSDYTTPTTASSYRTSLVQWSRGIDVLDENSNGSKTDARRAIGDILHSKPLLMTYGGTDANPDMTLFVGTNEGFIHAINAVNGTEHFAFIPKELLPNLNTLFENSVSQKHPYGMDGALSLWHNDVNHNGILLDSSNNVEPGEFVYLYAGMRRGGNHYYAFDVTDRSHPKLKWQIDGGAGDFAELGQTWSRPIVTKIKLNTGSGLQERHVLIFAGGYDPNQDIAGPPVDDTLGHAIYIVDASTGQRLWWASSTTTANLVLPEMVNSIPSDITVLDMNQDGYADRLYVGDTGGRIWRLDLDNINNTNPGNFAKGGLLAKFGGTTTVDNRRFYYPPSVALVNGTGGDMLTISIGSGYRAHPLNTATHDRIYSIHDMNPFSLPPDTNSDGQPDYSAYTEADLYDATANDLGQATGTTLTTAQAAFASAKGWYIRLAKSDGTYVGEKVLSTALTYNGVLMFTTFTPVAAAQTTACAPSQGTAKAYSVNLANATPAYNLVADGIDYSAADRATTLVRGGIPPEPTVVFFNGQDVKLCGTELCDKPTTRPAPKKGAWRQIR